MLSPTSIGSLPTKPGFYWYIPEIPQPSRHGRNTTETVREPCVCEFRAGESVLRFTDGSRQRWVRAGDAFFGPLPRPDQAWTVYWLDGKREVLHGESFATALRAAGHEFEARAQIAFQLEGIDEGGFLWNAATERWQKPQTLMESAT